MNIEKAGGGERKNESVHRSCYMDCINRDKYNNVSRRCSILNHQQVMVGPNGTSQAYLSTQEGHKQVGDDISPLA